MSQLYHVKVAFLVDVQVFCGKIQSSQTTMESIVSNSDPKVSQSATTAAIAAVTAAVAAAKAAAAKQAETKKPEGKKE